MLALAGVSAMVQRIGKYEVIERIGRGGMGTIFKTRDPILVFHQAQARQVEGDGLAARQDLAGTTQAYRDAADRYGEAIVRARAARSAKQAGLP